MYKGLRVAPMYIILKATLLTSLSLTGTPSCTTTEDRVAMQVGLVEGCVGTSTFLLTDGAGELVCEVEPSGDDSWVQSGLLR
jgi:hypothetical protein